MRRGARFGACTTVLVALLVMAASGACGEDGAATSGTGGTGGAPTSGGAGPGGGDGGSAPVEPTMLFEEQGLSPEHMAIVVNDQDPVSVALGAYYQQARAIPAANVITLSFATDAVLPSGDFPPLKAQLDAALPATVQALALTWDTPYRVGCMSVTSAFALGFSDTYCNTTGGACGPTAPVDYFDSDSSRPFDDHGIRPAMTIAAAVVEDGEALIDRGLAADASFPSGDGYFVRTTDTARSVRWPWFIDTVDSFDPLLGLDMTYVDNADGSGSNVIEDTNDILFYFTGLANVPGIATNEYIPGAVADHLTSFGGRMPDAGGQMSVLRWLEAGATGSYGTTVEPCNYTEKFPNTAVMVPRYFRGETLIEAYWKSVHWPGEGVFVGEPLARPWGSRFTVEDGAIAITTTSLVPGETYQIVAGPSEDGPWTPVVDSIAVDDYGFTELEVTDATEAFYLLRPVPAGQ